MNLEDVKVKVLVYDPNLDDLSNSILPDVVISFHNYFYPGRTLDSLVQSRSGERSLSMTDRNIQFEATNDLNTLVGKVQGREVFDKQLKSRSLYSIVIYPSDSLKAADAACVSRAHKRDPYMPQLIYGPDLPTQFVINLAKGGVLHSAKDQEELSRKLKTIFRKPQPIDDLTVFKLGGSGMDFDDDNKFGKNIQYVCDILRDIHGFPGEIIHPMVGCVGTGRRGDLIKGKLIKYPDNPLFSENYPWDMAYALELNLEDLRRHFKGYAKAVKSGMFFPIDSRSASGAIQLIAMAPHYTSVSDGIPLQDSDTHMIAIARFWGSENPNKRVRIVLIKRTDGIYDFDPYRGFVPDKRNGYCSDYETWSEAQARNGLHSTVTFNDLLSGKLSREGTGVDGRADGTTGHLIEDSALRYILERCPNINEIQVVPIAPEEMYRPIGGGQFKHIILPEVLNYDPRLHVRESLEQNLRNAIVHGIARSKIVRG